MAVAAETRYERGEEGPAPHQGRQHHRQILARHLPRLLPLLQHRLLGILHAGRDAGILTEIMKEGSETEFLALKHTSRILRHPSNPVCGFSMIEQVRLHAV